jgi:hypothetical protein
MTVLIVISVGVGSAVWGALMGIAWEKSREAMRRRAEYRRRSAARFGRAIYWNGEGGIVHIDFTPEEGTGR